jgi:hypothetical protein
MNTHGKILSDSLSQYLEGTPLALGSPNPEHPLPPFSKLDWETVEGRIMELSGLAEWEKRVLVDTAQLNPQAELIISEVVWQVAEPCYGGVLALTAHLLQLFAREGLAGLSYH